MNLQASISRSLLWAGSLVMVTGCGASDKDFPMGEGSSVDGEVASVSQPMTVPFSNSLDSRYVLKANESETMYLDHLRPVAFGASGTYNGAYTFAVLSGEVRCGLAAFPTDPYPGKAKQCFIFDPSSVYVAPEVSAEIWWYWKYAYYYAMPAAGTP